MLVRLSQGLLELLEHCPRKFQNSYLEQLAGGDPPDRQERLVWGSRFHQLMQQQELGLPLSLETRVPAAEVEQLRRCVTALQREAPDLFPLLQTGQSAQASFPVRSSEHARSLWMDGVLLTVVYDLLILDEHHATIIDWKTYPRPRRTEWLFHHWQTRLYLFLLAETAPYPPEAIAMTYWFVQAEGQNGTIVPQHLTIPYSIGEHEQTRYDLKEWIRRLTGWLQDYEQGMPFPQVDESMGLCGECPFTVRCQRGALAQPVALDAFLPLSEIEEIVP